MPGRKGKINHTPELAYVIGALLGDGCTYEYKPNHKHTILVGDQDFCKKYASRINTCSNSRGIAHPNRSKKVWFVKVNNYELFSLFEKTRENPDVLVELLNDKSSKVRFVEGFFDAEGCIKIVGKNTRKTPKICLDVANTNKKYLDVVRKSLKEALNIELAYSVQKARTGKDGIKRKKVYHLRIYKKKHLRKLFENNNTTKLCKKKRKYAYGWLNNSLGS